ncbi:MAG: hypothetical protein ACYC9D_10625 [Candidatus Dormibacteria bacterium]
MQSWNPEKAEVDVQTVAFGVSMDLAVAEVIALIETPWWFDPVELGVDVAMDYKETDHSTDVNVGAGQIQWNLTPPSAELPSNPSLIRPGKSGGSFVLITPPPALSE